MKTLMEMGDIITVLAYIKIVKALSKRLHYEHMGIHVYPSLWPS
jgi:hypothetical protein